MARQRIASIDATKLYKGQVISPELAWEHYVIRKPEVLQSWITEHGDEETAKAARLSLVLQRVLQWLERDRNQADMPPLVMNTAGGCINVLTDDRASEYLNNMAYAGLRRHQRATSRLVNAVDASQLTGASKREHQNRLNVHSFISASTRGAQNQLRLLKRAGQPAPRLEGAESLGSRKA